MPAPRGMANVSRGLSSPSPRIGFALERVPLLPLEVSRAFMSGIPRSPQIDLRAAHKSRRGAQCQRGFQPTESSPAGTPRAARKTRREAQRQRRAEWHALRVGSRRRLYRPFSAGAQRIGCPSPRRGQPPNRTHTQRCTSPNARWMPSWPMRLNRVPPDARAE